MKYMQIQEIMKNKLYFHYAIYIRKKTLSTYMIIVKLLGLVEK